MNKMLFITQREKEGEKGDGSVTQLRKLHFCIILFEIKPEEVHFPGKGIQGERNGRTQCMQFIVTRADPNPCKISFHLQPFIQYYTHTKPGSERIGTCNILMKI